jgi:hypothetical protein
MWGELRMGVLGFAPMWVVLQVESLGNVRWRARQVRRRFMHRRFK